MSAITTHILDTARGRPATGVAVTLEMKMVNEWRELAKGVTNSDGRVPQLLPEHNKIKVGVYRMTFETGGYWQANEEVGFYPYVSIVFEIKDPDQHYHVPLLLSPFGYSTYRGS